MKKLCLVFLAALLIIGCQRKEEEPVTLTLQKQHIIVGVNGKIDYPSYISASGGNSENSIYYEEIDTSQIGRHSVVYSLEGATDVSMSVDVVEMFDNGIFNPTSVEAIVVDNPDDVTVLINKLYAIPSDYKPDDLEAVIDNSSLTLRKEANEAYTQLYNDASRQGIELYSISAYRTFGTQDTYWNNMVNVFGIEYASKYSAYPGRSEHQLGLAIDVSYKTTGDRLNESVADSEIGQFLRKEGYKYGFVIRYPESKEEITNYGYEPWHIRYVGVELATKLYEDNLTLEEYYGF